MDRITRQLDARAKQKTSQVNGWGGGDQENIEGLQISLEKSEEERRNAHGANVIVVIV